jgi:hypothetical protein
MAWRLATYTSAPDTCCSAAAPFACLQFIWEAVSHELGHTLGLLHDGIAPNPAQPAGNPYTTGQGIWAPIMVRKLPLLLIVRQTYDRSAARAHLSDNAEHCNTKQCNM